VLGLAEVAAAWRAEGTSGLLRSLATSGSGLVGQGVRFALTGGVVALVYLGSTTLLADVAGLPFQAALALGFGLALLVHFTLQRQFVWLHETDFALPFRDQVGRYLVVAACQYGLTALSTLVLPHALGLPTEVVYLATVVIILATNFVVFRHGVFHARAY
jgi:putative flippase GtrA